MLARITTETFQQLRFIAEQMNNVEYSEKLEILNQSSVGQHIRHVLEFYICLAEGLQSGVVDYDKRKRNLELETNLDFALSTLDKLSEIFCCKDYEDTSLLHEVEYLGKKISTHSSVSRELIYLIEHSIHHYAIIGIAVRNHLKHIAVPENFGVAYSTASYHTQEKLVEVFEH